MKSLLFLVLFLSVIAYADNSSIWLPNLPAVSTGTKVSGHNGLDVNVISSLPITFPSNLPVSLTSPLPLPVSVVNQPANQPVSLTSPLPLPASIVNFPAVQPVSFSSPLPVTGTFFQATQPVSFSSPLPIQGGNSTAVKVDGSAVTQPVSFSSPLPVILSGANAPIYPNASFTQSLVVGSSGTVSLTVPSNAVGFILQAPSSNSVNIRWSITTAASTTSGLRLEPGRDTGWIPIAKTITVEAESSSSQEVDVIWGLNQ